MNIRRGLFRLWIVFSVLFLGYLLVDRFDQLDREFQKPIIKGSMFALLHPVACEDTRGKEGADYRKRDNLCWYTMKEFRRLFPEYADLSDVDVARRLHEQAGKPLDEGAPWNLLLRIFAVAIGVSVGVFAIGRAGLWAFDGFRSSGR